MMNHDPEDYLMRLEISADGFIKFIEMKNHYHLLIDGPVRDWSNGTISSLCGSKLTYDSSELESGYLQINGSYLRKYPTAINNQYGIDHSSNLVARY